MSDLPIDFSALLARARLGDDRAVADLVTHYQAIVRRAAHGMLGPAMRGQLDSMDVVQSVHRSLLIGLRQACGFRDGFQSLAKLGVVVLGVSADSGESHSKFAAKYKLPFPLLTDLGHRVMEKYGAWGEKVLYGKKVTGVIRSTVWIGPDGKVRKHWARVRDAAAHPAQVLDHITDGISA